MEELILDPEKYLGEPVTTSGYVWPAEEIPIEEGTSLDLEWLERLGFDLPDRIVLWKEEKEMSMYGISKDPPYGDEIGFTVGEIDHKPVENSLYSPSNRNVKQSEALLKVFGEVDRLSMENICPEHGIYMYFLKAEGAAALQEV